MKQIIAMLLLIPFLSLTSNAQDGENSKRYEKGKYILEQTTADIQKSDGIKNYIDYWNLALASTLMDADKETVLKYLNESIKGDSKGFYELTETLVSYYENDIENTDFYKLLGDEFIDLIEQSKRLSIVGKEEQKQGDIVNQEVVNTLQSMMKRDQKYRQNQNFLTEKELQEKQAELDAINTKELSKLFETYGYPGKSITGDNEYKNYACLIVEHGQPLENQKRWLPLVAAAFKNGELNANPLKMLLDRIHTMEFKKQYFGSHASIPLETKEEIERIKLKYGIE